MIKKIENHQTNLKNIKKKKKNIFFLSKNSNILKCTILNKEKKILFVFQYQEYPIRPELSSPAQSWEKNLEKSGKISENFENLFFCRKKCYSLKFSNSVSESRGGTVSVTEDKGRKSPKILVSNIECCVYPNCILCLCAFYALTLCIFSTCIRCWHYLCKSCVFSTCLLSIFFLYILCVFSCTIWFIMPCVCFLQFYCVCKANSLPKPC